MTTIVTGIVVIVLVVVLGGGGGSFGYTRGCYGGRSFGGLLGFLPLLVVLYVLFGGGTRSGI